MTTQEDIPASPARIRRLKTQLIYIYDTYRIAALNRAYYGLRLSRYQRCNFWMEIAIALGATGSAGVAGLAVWQTLPGSYAWLSISALATVLGVLKPVLHMGKAIENYTKLYAGHTNIYLELKNIVEEISLDRSISDKSMERYMASKQLAKELGGLEDINPNKRLIQKLQSEVNQLIPPETLWTPDESE